MEQAYFNFQGSAALALLAFLGTALLLLVTAAPLLFLLASGRLRAARWVLQGGLAVIVVYLGVLLAFSLGSREQRLAPRQEKYFCELDCHLAYSVAAARQTPVIGRSTARGTYYLVTLNVRFDEQTISPRRGDGPLYPNPRSVAVLDEQGTRYAPSPEGQRALEEARGAGTPLTRPLRPGESYRSTLVFDLPAEAREPRLLLTESGWVTRLLIGHENSFLHRKTSFSLAPAVHSAALIHCAPSPFSSPDAEAGEHARSGRDDGGQL